jgi:hypothetical protein
MKTDDNTKGIIIATDGSMLSARADDVLYTEAEDEKDFVEVGEGGQCIKCVGFFSLMILLPGLVFMFIHLGNNDWKFNFSDSDSKDVITFKDIDIPSVS